ncbi:MAG: hypothetical protein ABEJ03_06275 [Candidatus Nanohaloarchaea archaeon]
MAVGTGTKYLAFLITVHTLLYFAGANGIISQQQGDNPHKKYVNQFRGDNLTEASTVDDDSNIIDGTFGPAVKALDFIKQIGGILLSPYTVVEDSQLPKMFIWIIQGLFGLFEAVIIAQFLRGAAF